ncbi:hypothetical protein [Psychrobacter sp. Ps3]|uniref:hypothetical protein n=1 Tax=Psychrobacter sp. Ps3 TaxID=2790957 RepID=UPI001EDE0AE0|nr:hypothetical protein [Psychrobacter sp. Ps3]MCG3882636.1 hypothetical protein [Psychrobacter sp. Ps3]
MNNNKTLETRILHDWSYTNSLMIKSDFKVSLSGYYDDKEKRVIIDEDLVASPSIDKHEDSYLYETIFNRMKFELKETIKIKQKILDQEA